MQYTVWMLLCKEIAAHICQHWTTFTSDVGKHSTFFLNAACLRLLLVLSVVFLAPDTLLCCRLTLWIIEPSLAGYCKRFRLFAVCFSHTHLYSRIRAAVSVLWSCKHSRTVTDRRLFFCKSSNNHFMAMLVSLWWPAPPVKNRRILSVRSFTACMPLLMATSAWVAYRLLC